MNKIVINLLKAISPIDIKLASQFNKQNPAMKGQRPDRSMKNTWPHNIPTASNESIKKLIEKSATAKLNTIRLDVVLSSLVAKIAPIIVRLPSTPVNVPSRARDV